MGPDNYCCVTLPNRSVALSMLGYRYAARGETQPLLFMVSTQSDKEMDA